LEGADNGKLVVFPPNPISAEIQKYVDRRKLLFYGQRPTGLSYGVFEE
jgi:hypothetical protein